METERTVPPLPDDKKPEVLDGEARKLVPWRPAKAPTPPPVGAGLENMGNTCFLNAVLQCITHTVPLLQSLGSSTHPYPCSGDTGNFVRKDGRFCSLCALMQHMEICVHESGCVVKPGGFVNNLSNISSSFSRYQQEDAHEFLHCLLDNLHCSCLSPHAGDDNSSQKDSFIKNIFGGRLRSQIQCCECGHRSDTYEPLLDLSLEIEDAESLEDALESFTKVEKIEDPEVKFTCEGCKARVCVLKQFKLDQAPPVVALHLKRFKSNGYSADKIDEFVKYPVDLDLKPFYSNREVEGELKYELYAAVMHHGLSPFYGHYYCFIRPSPDLWYIMDDEKAYSVSEEYALTQNAYILFYMKRGTPWFASLKEGGEINKYLHFGNMASPVSVVDHVETCHNSSSESEDNCNNSVQTPRRDENLNSCGAVPSDSEKDRAERENVSCPHGTSKCVVPEIEGTQAHAVNGDMAAPSMGLAYAYLDSKENKAGVDNDLCPFRESLCNVPEIERKQADDTVGSCSAAPHCEPCSSSSDYDVNEAERSYIASIPGVTKTNAPDNEGNLAGGASNVNKIATPFTTKQSSIDRFYDETWEDEKENSPNFILNSQAGKSAERADKRELAAVNSILRSMPRSRRIGLEQSMRSGGKPSSSDHQRKRKLCLDSKNSPRLPSSTTRAVGNPFPSSFLHQLVAEDDSNLILAIDSNRRG